ncbi:MAG: hypothetical protein HC800_15040 [Phormidesmis sp. RL_2_1]|nr:hypothetical protein [Phormidesmis sp. RL_2_1]
MRNVSHPQSQVKVAVLSVPATSAETQRQQLQEKIAIALVVISALTFYWAA